MKFSSIIGLAALAHSASAHYIWHTLIAGNTTSQSAIRQPISNYPLEIGTIASNQIRCNDNPDAANATVPVASGATIGFQLLEGAIFHEGPAAIYLGKAPTTAASWDGSGVNWFKIAEWGATYDPFAFTNYNATQLTTTIPTATPPGEYLARIEQVGLHITGAPQWYVSCAQIKITGSGTGNPSKVSIPGYVNASDPELTLSIYDPVPTSYRVPGPDVWRG